ncbi:MAG: Alpha/Beta hydrolase protein, partial [Olpidium bornovanus]
TLYHIKYCIAAYGSALLNLCGYGNGIKVGSQLTGSLSLFFLRQEDAVRLQSDRKVVCDVFKLDPDLDLITWQYDKNRIFKPKYFVVRDPHTNCIVVVVRGTFSLQDAMTDLLCEYEPYKGGLAHRGVIRSAEWIVDRSFEAIKNAVARFNAAGINCVGHSLGGAVASLVCLMIHDRIGELAELTSSPEFRVRAYSIGSPPWASRDLAEQAGPLVTAVVNEADLVPRLSFGNVTLM